MSSTGVAGKSMTPLQQQAAAFVTGLAICSRHARAYPPGHPAVAAALEKTLALLAPLVGDGERFTLGVARHAFMVGDEFLERQNGNLVQYADILSSLGIMTLGFSGKVDVAELGRFVALTVRPREDVWEEGGIRRAFGTAGITGIEVQAIDPSLFSLSEEFDMAKERKGVWERLLRNLIDGRFPVPREKLLQMLLDDPAQLAALLDSLMADLNETLRFASIQSVAKPLSELAHRADPAHDAELLRKLLIFVSSLSPQLRRDFLETFILLAGDDVRLEELLFDRLPAAVLADALNAAVAHGAQLPQLVLKLMQRLTAATAAVAPQPDAPRPAGMTQGLQVLSRRDEFEKYVPPAYREALAAIIATDRLDDADEAALAELRETLRPARLEAETAEVIRQLLGTLSPEEQGEGIQRSLAEMTRFFLGQGDFRSLARTCAMVGPGPGHDAVFTPGFVAGVLKGLASSGRERQREIRDVVTAGGRPFVVPLMERLAVEQDRSLRRFCFDCLLGLGGVVRETALERLKDDRWYFVRNLLILLRAFPDREVQVATHRFMQHPHPKVRFEALKSAVLSHDPVGERFLLQELEADDVQRQLAAIQLAEFSRSSAVLEKLLRILEVGTLEYHLELKSAVVAALAAIGNPEALPRLEKVLRSHNLLHPLKHRQLQAEIAGSLGRYPAASVRSLIREFGSEQHPAAGEEGRK